MERLHRLNHQPKSHQPKSRRSRNHRSRNRLSKRIPTRDLKETTDLETALIPNLRETLLRMTKRTRLRVEERTSRLSSTLITQDGGSPDGGPLSCFGTDPESAKPLRADSQSAATASGTCSGSFDMLASRLRIEGASSATICKQTNTSPPATYHVRNPITATTGPTMARLMG